MAVLMSMGPEATGAADGTSSPLKHGFDDLHFLQYVDNAIYMMQHGNTSTSDMMSSLMRDFWKQQLVTSNVLASQQQLLWARTSTGTPMLQESFSVAQAPQIIHFWSKMGSHVD